MWAALPIENRRDKITAFAVDVGGQPREEKVGVTKTKVNYGNWVSARIILAPATLAIVLGALSLLSRLFLIPAGLLLILAGYFAYARYLFSARGGNVQEKIRALVLEGLEWDGRGKALDIGCGSAALAIGIAKKFPSSAVIGTDCWSGSWEYSQKNCEDNAAAEKVEERVAFQKASASALPFSDGEFDAVVSNLVFHEVKDAQDKLGLIKEGLARAEEGREVRAPGLVLHPAILRQARGHDRDDQEVGY